MGGLFRFKISRLILTSSFAATCGHGCAVDQDVKGTNHCVSRQAHNFQNNHIGFQGKLATVVSHEEVVHTAGAFQRTDVSWIGCRLNASHLAATITDPSLRGLPVIGSIDQITDATPLIVAPERARRAMAALYSGGKDA